MQNKIDTLRHSTAHVLASAVFEMFPDAKFGIGPTIENGFYYDFDLPRTLIPEDLPILEKKMKDIIKANLPFERKEIPREEAIKLFTKANQPYKVELIKKLEDEKVSIYKTGNFVDLCRGPHIDSTGEIRNYKLTHIAGAYWCGKESNPMLQRIYGTAFENSKELRKHLHNLEEAKKRDHRKLGKELELFMFSREIGPGLPIWLPKGSIIKEELEKWGKETEEKWNYDRISTPIMTKRKLFEISGHIPYFEEEMYKVKVPGDKKEEYFLKPMNCPSAHIVYKSKLRSYKDLPVRLAEYGKVLRYENQGALNGILRPREFTQNDAHIYCSEEQTIDIFVEIIDLHRYYYDTLGLKDYYIVLELRDPKNKDKYHGDEEMWKKSEKYSIEAIDKAGIKYVVKNEGAAHYGPKMDFKIRSVIGTEYGISTNQIDFYTPKRFGLTYIDKDGKEKPIIVLHRAPLGSDERFVGFLIEHYAGAFPLWLSPVHVRILPISEKFKKYADKVLKQLREKKIRAEIDDSEESLGKKIRNAEKGKVPYMLIIGEKEEKGETVSVRSYKEKDLGAIKITELLAKMEKEIEQKK